MKTKKSTQKTKTCHTGGNEQEIMNLFIENKKGEQDNCQSQDSLLVSSIVTNVDLHYTGLSLYLLKFAYTRQL